MKSFSGTELSTLHNTKFFEVKASATKKIEHLFAEVRDGIKNEIKRNKIIFPKEIDAINGKIFRGENYLGLPYLVLDFPKHFSKDSVLAFRTMFWWGNFFSFTLHLQGKALEEWRKQHTPLLLSPKDDRRLRTEFGLYARKGIHVCLNNNPWQYHYAKENYVLFDKLSTAEINKILLKKEFVKLSRKLALKDYKKLSAFCRESFRILA